MSREVGERSVVRKRARHDASSLRLTSFDEERGEEETESGAGDAEVPNVLDSSDVGLKREGSLCGGEGGEGWDESRFGRDGGDDVGREAESEKSVSKIMAEERRGRFSDEPTRRRRGRRRETTHRTVFWSRELPMARATVPPRSRTKLRIRRRDGIVVSGCEESRGSQERSDESRESGTRRRVSLSRLSFLSPAKKRFGSERNHSLPSRSHDGHLRSRYCGLNSDETGLQRKETR